MLVLLIALLLIAILIPHYNYLLKAVRIALNTGRLYPTPDELRFFPNREIKASYGKPWDKHESYGMPKLRSEDLVYLKDLETTAFLVIAGGQLLFEKYWEPYGPDYTTSSFSVAKSILGTLAGIAINMGKLRFDDPLSKYLSDLKIKGLEQVTVQHALAMATGIQWSESSGNPFSDNASAYFCTDILAKAKNIYMRGEPGKYFEYRSGNSLLLAMALKEAVGMSVSAFAERHLWGPLGSEHNAYWQTDKENGMEKAFCCFYAVPVDFARLGQLYLNGGTMFGKRLLSEDFVNRAIQSNTYYDKMLNQENIRYGLHWWTFNWEEKPCYYARGIYGQYVIVVPDRELVIVRLGFHRKKVDETGHPTDLFEYPEIARRLLDQT